MATKPASTEPTRPLPEPHVGSDGNWHTTASLSPTSMKTRGRLPIPPSRIVPVIVIPGIMGSNLRANTTAQQAKNNVLNPGEEAWRPPNGVPAGVAEAKKWEKRTASERQLILDPSTLEVDPTGEIEVPINSDAMAWDPKLLCERGWGEIHSSSYGGLLVALYWRLNATFRLFGGIRAVGSFWLALNKFDRESWGTTKSGLMTELSDAELEKFSEYHYPVYAFGYNWLQSNKLSAGRLALRIEAILAEWTAKKRQCESVILVTHSMGGLVGRACAKQIPHKVLGVIHGAMPAWGAPVCYRRIAWGTESFDPNKEKIDNAEMDKFADIAGRTSADTTAVMATAPGPLELLPNHLYNERWLHATVTSHGVTSKDVLKLPEGNPYDLYRNTETWYRLIDPSLADPANLYKGLVLDVLDRAISAAESFHKEVLGNYYHPNTFAFCGADKKQLTLGVCRWDANITSGVLSVSDLRAGKPISATPDGRREVIVNKISYFFSNASSTDLPGDGTVPLQSGSAPAGRIRQLFKTNGYDHQDSYNDRAMLYLTQHLIARLVLSK